jgi:predicted transcriptional regulator
VRYVRRNNLDIFADILKAARRGARKTRIVYQANLNFKIVENYLRNLILMGYLEPGGEGVYVTTSKGIEFLQRYEELLSLMPEARLIDVDGEMIALPNSQVRALMNGGRR